MILQYCTQLAAQPAHAVDAAARPRDQSFFEGQNQPKRCTHLLVAAHLMGIPFGSQEVWSASLFWLVV
jgi:hypothetical protein